MPSCHNSAPLKNIKLQVQFVIEEEMASICGHWVRQKLARIHGQPCERKTQFRHTGSERSAVKASVSRIFAVPGQGLGLSPGQNRLRP